MASTAKKRGSIESKMGRPADGSLSTYPKFVLDKIKELRKDNEGWGAMTIIVELREEYKYFESDIPSVDSVRRYLKQEGFIKPYVPASPLPTKPCKEVKEIHQLWEMDAQGATKVSGIGYQATINMKDSLSKKYCMSFPVVVKNGMTQPRTIHYKWAFRFAFIESGLPSMVQVDKDSVFIENTSKSPYPSRLHLWLLSLGVDLCFIDVRPPQKQAMVERSHQTIERQAVKGKHFDTWSDLFKNMNKRRKRLNEKYPSRSLDRKAPLEAYPKAIHSGRIYSPKKEYILMDLNRIYDFLAEGKWYRIVSSGRTISLGNQSYYLKHAVPKSQVQITFNKETKHLVFHDTNEKMIAQRPIKGITKENLMDIQSGGTSKEINSKYQSILAAIDFPL